jgi:hypothetical protein
MLAFVAPTLLSFIWPPFSVEKRHNRQSNFIRKIQPVRAEKYGFDGIPKLWLK